MVEGHGIHRIAYAHRRLLLNKVFKASSPNGRFTEGAKLINGAKLADIQAIGKNLFYFFSSSPNKYQTVIVHIHLGMSGAFRSSPLLPISKRLQVENNRTLMTQVTPTTRLLLENEDDNIVAALSAMTCQYGGPELYESKRLQLGPDPLREDADKERFWNKMKTSKKSIGLLLMDQNAIAGVGNIYRAEILFKAKIHPEQAASSIDRDTFEKIWNYCVLLLQRGFLTGSIITVDAEESYGPPWTRRYIYNHSQCPKCKGSVRTWDIGGRTVYCCPSCQPLFPETNLEDSRVKAVAKASITKEFVSHCASEDVQTLTPSKMLVSTLKAELSKRGLSTQGLKAVLVARLSEVWEKEKGAQEAEKKETIPHTPSIKKEKTVMVVIPGTAHLGRSASAKAAALEKINAGEKRNVEHIGLHDEEEEEVILAEAASQKKKKRRVMSSKKEFCAEVALPGDNSQIDRIFELEYHE